MSRSQHFPYIETHDGFGFVELLPKLPIVLSHKGRSVSGVGLLDTGASVNVLPFSLGRDLGLVWDELTMVLSLAGNLARLEARGVLVNAVVGEFEPVRMVFAWCKSDDVPLLLGRMNFFAEFNVCLYQHQLMFEVTKHEQTGKTLTVSQSPPY
ncbi:MAG: retroviral-like aspartic protease [Alkalinema sp. RU_4_3]|nr:retroviral-like aspartic protease [Alkalinema sp. RU_4_3]